MTLAAWVSFCVLETVLCLIPGPAVLYVGSTALTRGLRAGLAGALGILAGNICYFALSATGVAAIILAAGQWFTWLTWVGAAYLVWLGLRMLFVQASSGALPLPQPAARALTRGLIVQLSNPKALVFFVALLPQFINPRAPVGWQILILGVSSVLIESVVLLLYVILAVRASAMAGGRLAITIERFGGALLVAAGLRLAWMTWK